jgi:hypothetical protein
MRKLDLIRDGEELYEVVRRIACTKFTKSVEGDNATTLKEWARCEKILKSNHTNEYLFVNLIKEVDIIEENVTIKEETPSKKLI